MHDPLLLATTRVLTFAGDASLTNASGFFYSRNGRLFLITSRHVLLDEAIAHRPDRVEVDLHVDANDVARVERLSVPLYLDGVGQWRDALDRGGEIDVAAIEIDQAALSATVQLHAFEAAHQAADQSAVRIGAPILIVGYPLGFHDTLHRTPVARQAVVASDYGLRFQGEGFFLTDARTHRGLSGAPVVMRAPDDIVLTGELNWILLGVHSSRLDISARDVQIDEALGLNCAWYADVLETLTAG